PAMLGIPQPRVAVLSGNEDVGGAGYASEVLHAPGIDFANRHLFPLRYEVDANISWATWYPRPALGPMRRRRVETDNAQPADAPPPAPRPVSFRPSADGSAGRAAFPRRPDGPVDAGCQ